MTKTFRYSLLSICLLLSISAVKAQTYLGWDTYGIGFAVASDFYVNQNNNQVFDATSSDGLVSINLQPWLDSRVSEDNLYDWVVYQATALNFYDGGAVSGDYIQIDDFNGYFMVCAPNSADSYDFIIYAILLDVYSNTNLQVIIGYQDGHFNEARNMLLSLYAYD